MGVPVSTDEILPLVYEQLRALASKYAVGHATVAPTSIVHEAFLKLRDGGVGVNDLEHFRALAATAMRQVLVDRARRRRSAKHGGDLERVTLSFETGEPQDYDVVALNDALTRLAELDARQARIVELRFFAGMTNPEVATALEVSTSTVEKEWRRARLAGGRAPPHLKSRAIQAS